MLRWGGASGRVWRAGITLAAGSAATAVEQAHAIREWHVADGLASEEVRALGQDGQGYLWLTAGETLQRFDGTHFVSVAAPPPAEAGAPGRRVTAETTAAGDLLLLAPDGIFRLDTGARREEPVLSAPGGIEFSAVHSAGAGKIWAAGHDGSLVEWSAQGVAVQRPFGPLATYRPAAFATGGAGDQWVMVGRSLARRVQGEWRVVPLDLGGAELRLAPSRTGGPWLVAGARLFKLAGDQPEARVELPTLAGAHFIRALREDRDGVLWIGTRSQGLYAVANDRVVRVPTPHDDILAVFQSSEGSIWVGTNGGGLYRVRPRLARLYDKAAGLVDNRSETVCEDRDGTLWLANRDGGVATVRDNVVRQIVPAPGQPRFTTGSVAPTPAGGVWVTSRAGLFHIAGGEAPTIRLVPGIPSMQTSAVSLAASNGDLWLAVAPDRVGRLRAEQFASFGPDEGYGGGRVRSLAEDAGGRIWVAGNDGRLWRTDGHRFQLVAWDLPGPHRPIQSILFDSDGTRWLGTAGQGLIIGRGERWRRVDTRHGLPDDTIAHILRDHRGNLWFGSSGGIFRLEARELLSVWEGTGAGPLHPVVLGRDEDLRNLSCLGTFQPAGWKGRDGRLWFATRSGVLAINPEVEVATPVLPRIAIEEVRCDGQAVVWGHRHVLPSRVQKLEIRFSILCLATPGRVRARHQLDGFDPGWAPASADRVALYPALPPGNYTFRVAASAAPGPENEHHLAFAFVVTPEWWQTLWFRAGAAAAAVLLVAFLVRTIALRRLRRQVQHLERERAIERERTRIAENIHDDLGASLTRISLLTQGAAPDAGGAQSRLEQIYATTTEITRKLDEIVWAINPKYDDLDGLVYYLGNYAQNFLGLAGIRCRLEIPPTLPALQLSSQARYSVFLAAKEALHNLVKHSGASEAVLTVSAVGPQLEVALSDNGRGFDPAARPLGSLQRSAPGHGLRQMETRLASVGGTCTLRTSAGDGTVVVFTLPLAANS